MAHLADPVAALVQAKGRGLDTGELLARSLDERRQLCSFVGDGLALGVVLIIGIRARRCGEQGLEVLGQFSSRERTSSRSSRKRSAAASRSKVRLGIAGRAIW